MINKLLIDGLLATKDFISLIRKEDELRSENMPNKYLTWLAIEGRAYAGFNVRFSKKYLLDNFLIEEDEADEFFKLLTSLDKNNMKPMDDYLINHPNMKDFLEKNIQELTDASSAWKKYEGKAKPEENMKTTKSDKKEENHTLNLNYKNQNEYAADKIPSYLIISAVIGGLLLAGFVVACIFSVGALLAILPFLAPVVKFIASTAAAAGIFSTVGTIGGGLVTGAAIGAAVTSLGTFCKNKIQGLLNRQTPEKDPNKKSNQGSDIKMQKIDEENEDDRDDNKKEFSEDENHKYFDQILGEARRPSGISKSSYAQAHESLITGNLTISDNNNNVDTTFYTSSKKDTPLPQMRPVIKDPIIPEDSGDSNPANNSMAKSTLLDRDDGVTPNP